MADFDNISSRKDYNENPQEGQYRDRVIMDPDLNDGSVQPRQINEIPKQEKEGVLPDTDNGITISVPRKSGIRMLTPEEAAQLDDNNRVEIPKDSIHTTDEFDKIRMNNPDSLENMLAETLETETKRADAYVEAMTNPETRENILQGTDKKDSDKVIYRSQDMIPSYENSDIQDRVDSNIEDLVPAYDDEEEENTDTDPGDMKDKNPLDEMTETQYKEYIRGLTEVKAEGETIVVTKKDRVTTVSSERLTDKRNLSDSAFMSAVTKFKKDNFRTVTVPLINSGFMVDVVGTGATDLTLLYNNADENTDREAYTLDKMRVTMRQITGTSPKIPKDDLKNMIHFADYNMLAYAHIAATLKDLETIHTCSECGEDFRIVCKSSDMIINLDEFRDRIKGIQNATDVSEYSLMLKDREFQTDDGLVVIIGHPSYADYITYDSERRVLINNLDDLQKRMFDRIGHVMPFIRSVVLPNGIRTNNAYQKFIALGLISDEEWTDLEKMVADLSSEIKRPSFGIKSVKCPKCGKRHTDIRYSNLEDMLFFHTMVTRMMKITEN